MECMMLPAAGGPPVVEQSEPRTGDLGARVSAGGIRPRELVTPSPTPAGGSSLLLRPRTTTYARSLATTPTAGLAPALPDALEEEEECNVAMRQPFKFPIDVLGEKKVPYEPSATEYIVIDSSDEDNEEAETTNETNTSGGGTQPSFASGRAVAGSSFSSSSCQSSSLLTDSRTSIPRRVSMPSCGLHGGTVSVGEAQPTARHSFSPAFGSPHYVRRTASSWPHAPRWNSAAGSQQQRQQQQRYLSPVPAIASSSSSSSHIKYYMTPGAPVNVHFGPPHPLYSTLHSGRRAAAFSPEQHNHHK
jgi:hypothetical protein